MPKSWLKRLKKEVLVLDGAMGTMLQAKGLAADKCPELINVEKPEWVADIARSYSDAGSDIVSTNTFGGSRYKLKKYGLGERMLELNRTGVAIVKEAVQGKALVAASMGPLGELIEPLGKLGFEEAVGYFAEQAKAFVKGGADLIIIDTMGDLQEARAALLAVKENTRLAVICQVTFENGGRTLTGSDPATVMTVLGGMGADVVGVNCSMGPEDLLELVQQMGQISDTPIVIQPNAGIPTLVKGETIFPATPKEMADYVQAEIQAGANIVGACCGSTVEHIKQIAKEAKKYQPQKRKTSVGRIASRSRCITFGANEPILIVGERINPTSRNDLQQELLLGKYNIIRNEAVEQAEAGVRVLDINVGMAGINETAALRNATAIVQGAVDTPLMLDSVDPAALEAALRIYCGKAIINSVNGKADSRRDVFPLARKYGAAVVGLTLDKKMPQTIKQRIAIAKKIINDAHKYGIASHDLIIDCLVFTAATDPVKAKETLIASELVKKEFGVSTLLGIGNISHGLPMRRKLNDAYLMMALAYGLDLVFVNSKHKDVFDLLAAAEVLVNRDPDSKRYIARALRKESDRTVSARKGKTGLAAEIERAIRLGDDAAGVALVRKALKKEEPLKILNKYLVPAITQIGEDYQDGRLFLPQLVTSAQTMTLCSETLQENLPQHDRKYLGRVLLATVENDIHSIGKNICCSLLTSNGYEVVDLGESVSSDKIIEVAQDKKVDLVGLSALMTTTLPSMEETIRTMKEKGMDIPVIVGGAVVTAQYARDIGAAGYAENAVATVTLVKKLLKS